MNVKRWLALAILNVAVAAAATVCAAEITVIHAERIFTGREFVEDVTVVIEAGTNTDSQYGH